MKYFILIIVTLLTMPWLAQAANVTEASEVVLWYEDQPENQQLRNNYIFTIDGDDTIYTCTANRCSMKQFADQGTVNITLYKLPEGFPRAANVIDQEILREYANLAEQTFRLEGIATDWKPVNNERPYQHIQLHADGSYEVTQVIYEKADLQAANAQSTADDDGLGIVWTIVLGVSAALLVLALAVLGWRYWQNHTHKQLQL